LTEEVPEIELLDLSVAIAAGGSGALLGRESEDLDLNLVRFAAGGGVGAHVNREVDVVIVALAGSGIIRVGGQELRLNAGNAIIIPKNTERAIQSTEQGEFAYLTVHRRRARLMPDPARAARA
jgi:quercetin dioxygenase-like cupin family protein